METIVPDYPKGLSFEKVWAYLQTSKEEFDRGLQKSREEFDSGLKKSREEYERRIKESDDRFNKKMGELGIHMGEFVGQMIEPNLLARFKDLGFSFTQVSRNTEFWYQGSKHAEVDAFLEDGEKVMAVEVKSKPTFDDVRRHIDRMNRLQVYANGKGDQRKYLGAIGGMVFGDNVRNFALKCGFYVIEPSGNTFNVIVPEGKYKPREW